MGIKKISRRERIGAVALIMVIMILIGVPYLYEKFSIKQEPSKESTIVVLEQAETSSDTLSIKRPKVKINKKKKQETKKEKEPEDKNKGKSNRDYLKEPIDSGKRG